MTNREIALQCTLTALMADGKTKKGLLVVGICSSLIDIIKTHYLSVANPETIDNQPDEKLDAVLNKLAKTSDDLIEFVERYLIDEAVNLKVVKQEIRKRF